jgi:hypothetical protein
MSAPDRILAYGARNTKFGPQWKAQPLPLMPLVEFPITEYRRADLPPTLSEALAVSEVQALVEALKEAKSEMRDWRIDHPAMREIDAALRAIEGGEAL